MKTLNILEKSKFVGYFGIPYLDEKTSGILPNDLVLIGARSGAGKSSLAQSIASHNSRMGTKVGLISLEDFKDDAFMTKVYYSYLREANEYDLSLRDFLGGLGTTFNPDMAALGRAEKKAEEYFKDMCLTTRQKGFGIEDLKETMVRNVVEDKCKIIIIDHIDYIDKIDPRENDVVHITEIMRTIRELQDIEGIAVIAFSHLRKPFGSKDLPRIPSMDEFIGSGNKVRESTMVVSFAPDDKRNETALDESVKSTFCCIRKLRHGGYDNTAARLFFDRRTGNYDENYEKCVVNYSGTEVIDVVGSL